ncbi:MAG: TetR/AcrR family transcriptional regulator [Cyanothece sp. SIO1E1]|nr:TetR/AcrR family transcriptional regulator [Cyanothece sp. SIO1E1]
MLAADLVLLEQGMENFTIDQVVAKANIAKGTVYKYYKSRDDLLLELSVKALNIMLEMFEEAVSRGTTSSEKVKNVCKASYQFYNEYNQYFILVTHIDRPEFKVDIYDYMKVSHKVQNMFQSIIEEGQRNGEFSSRYDPKYIQFIVWASSVGVVQFIDSKKALIENVNDVDIDEFINTYAELIASGLIKNSTEK